MPGTLERISAHILFPLLSIVTVPHWVGPVWESRGAELYKLGRKGMLIALVCVTGLLSNRWLYTGHSPLSDLYESLLFLSWGLCLTHIVLIRGRNDWLGVVTAPGAMLTYGFATISASVGDARSTTLVPASQSYWLMMHVSMMMPSYAALLCGSLLAMAFLVIASRSRPAVSTDSFDTTYPVRPALISMGYPAERPLEILIYSCMSRRRVKLSQWLDRWSNRIISLGFLFLTLGITSGAVRANEAWGYYWNWDPKETWALITWLTFAVYLHTRITRGWQGEKPAIVASLGYLITRIRHSGVNPLGRGPHSHGWLI
uniref:Cytochrome c biogenesis protein CcsA n=1 Tax=Selaginella lyallii TaxID=137159 RepID=A0A481ZJT9_9TRAC|nr:cytochrome c heme attachment protein [Selaginella lyallii]QBL02085.1 cytochrome c heme attachment protein [Selaginella lyallii]